MFSNLRSLVRQARAAIERAVYRAGAPATGKVDFGDLRNVRPVAEDFGFIRGMPVDRIYIEQFLERHREAICGSVLEAGDATYSRRFGDAINHQDIISITEGPAVTICDDLSRPGVLEPDKYDCIVLTQVLQYVWDLQTCAEQLHRSLKPGGTLLLTVPGISPVENAEADWFWAFNTAAIARLFEELFGSGNCQIQSFGNVFAATCFLQGVVTEDVDAAELAIHDPAYPVIIALKATKPA